jgi:hypothetical protein
MSKQFKVGTIVIGQNFIYKVECNGMEGEIDAPLAIRTAINPLGELETSLCYGVRWANGHIGWVSPPNLRRKPPQQDLTAWAAAKVKDITKPVNVPDQVPA